MPRPAIDWSDRAIRDLQAAYRRGGFGAVRKVFPGITKGRLQVALRRYVFDPANAATPIRVPISPEEARRRIAQFERDALYDGLRRLLRSQPGSKAS